MAMEAAGDVHDAFPNKEIIIACRSTILRKSGPAAHKVLSDHWTKEGATLFTDAAVMRIQPGDTHYKTAKVKPH